jgi:hypothetical protein
MIYTKDQIYEFIHNTLKEETFQLIANNSPYDYDRNSHIDALKTASPKTFKIAINQSHFITNTHHARLTFNFINYYRGKRVDNDTWQLCIYSKYRRDTPVTMEEALVILIGDSCVSQTDIYESKIYEELINEFQIKLVSLVDKDKYQLVGDNSYYSERITFDLDDVKHKDLHEKVVRKEQLYIFQHNEDKDMRIAIQAFLVEILDKNIHKHIYGIYDMAHQSRTRILLCNEEDIQVTMEKLFQSSEEFKKLGLNFKI